MAFTFLCRYPTHPQPPLLLSRYCHPHVYFSSHKNPTPTFNSSPTFIDLKFLPTTTFVPSSRLLDSVEYCVHHNWRSQLLSALVICAHHLRKAVREIGFVSGKVSSDKILDVIFADFCIGK